NPSAQPTRGKDSSPSGCQARKGTSSSATPPPQTSTRQPTGAAGSQATSTTEPPNTPRSRPLSETSTSRWPASSTVKPAASSWLSSSSGCKPNAGCGSQPNTAPRNSTTSAFCATNSSTRSTG